MGSNFSETCIRHLIWDVDGTLFDTYPAFVQAFQQVLPEFGVTIPDAEILAMVKISIMHLIQTLKETNGIDPNALGERFWEVYDAIPDTMQKPFPGVEDVLRWIITQGGSNLIVTHRRTETTLDLLKTYRLETLFKDIVATDAGFPRKPDPAMFIEAARRNQLRPDEVLSVGDREIDILGGQAAGMLACIFRPVDTATSADFTILEFSDLLDLLVRRCKS